MNSTSKNAENKTVNNLGIAPKFIILSLIGIFVFFVPIRAGGGKDNPGRISGKFSDKQF